MTVSKPVRYGMSIRDRPEQFEKNKKHHAAVWPDVMVTITRCHITNYSNCHRDRVRFSYCEYGGANIAADMSTLTTFA